MPMKKGMDMMRAKGAEMRTKAQGMGAEMRAKGAELKAGVHARNAERKAAHGKIGVGMGKGKGLVNRGKRGL